MNEQIADILRGMRELEERLEQELERSREIYACRIKGRFAEFQQEVIAQHRRMRVGILKFLATSSLPNLLVAPVIYSMILPLVALDIWATLYQHICFRVYRIPRVKRADYIAFDREHLAYLNAIEKLNCIYCGYGNGVAGYVREIASRTEQYWCPIKHARRILDPHRRYLNFLEYGDAEGYRQKLKDLRNDVQNP
jgi:hypothetical protein